ncbi:MAG: hypothetical protein FWD15_01160 [Alphaproteobacteria bacterium]|nr:hypothetical protein [Alphaproteobacteria bacterium]
MNEQKQILNTIKEIAADIKVLSSEDADGTKNKINAIKNEIGELKAYLQISSMMKMRFVEEG